MIYLVAAACVIASLNLLILKKTKNNFICGHIFTLLAFIVTSIANFWIGGIASTFFSWYYVVLILAAVMANWSGLIIYALLSTLMIVIFALFPVVPIYQFSSDQNEIMNFINLLFCLVVIASALYTLLRENIIYEKNLWDHNYLLQADKDKFHRLASYDTLTNLPNRSYFQTYIETLMKSVNLETHFITVFFMDLDRLKLINDAYGHDAGDSLLLQAGKRLQSCFRENDFLSRLGGDEFTAVLSHFKDDKVPQTIAQRILDEFNKPFEIGTKKINSSISIGLATYPTNAINANELITLADKAMYSAKKSGGNNFKEAEN